MSPRTIISIAAGVLALALLAGLIAWGAAGHNEAGELKRWSEVTCASAGEPFVHVDHTDPATGKQAKRMKRGVACAARVGELARFERETNTETAGVLLGALEDREGKTIADTASAARDARAARAAAERMEKENAAVEGDRVDPDWFDALNGVAGLRNH